RFERARRDHDVEPARGQRERALLADAAARAGDEGYALVGGGHSSSRNVRAGREPSADSGSVLSGLVATNVRRIDWVTPMAARWCLIGQLSPAALLPHRCDAH